jgi:uncharacterized protein (TIGR02001 family)
LTVYFDKGEIMRKSILALCAMATMAAGPSIAEEVKFSGSVTAASDYIWRGATQTDNSPAVFLAGQANYGNFYAGVGTENVDFAGINQEYDFWAGYVAKLSEGLTLDLGVVRYGYIDAPVDIDTLELKATLAKAIAKGSVSGTVMTTSNFFGSDLSATYYEVAGGYNVTDKLNLSGAVGKQTVEGAGGDYTTWNLGGTYPIAKNVGVDLRYHDAENLDSAVVASIKFSF